MLRICIDPGHGGDDRGMTNGNRHEADDVLKLGLLLRKKVLAQGIDVLITRAYETSVSIDKRCFMANKTHCCLFISLHRASLDQPPHRAACWISSSPDERSRRVGAALTEAAAKTLGFANGGVHTGTPSTRGYKDFSTNVMTEMPSVHLEIGSVLSRTDNKAFDDKLEECACALAKAICKAVGMRYNPTAVFDESMFQ